MKNGPRVWAFCKIEFPGIQKPVQILTQKSGFFRNPGNRGVGVIWLVCGVVFGFVVDWVFVASSLVLILFCLGVVFTLLFLGLDTFFCRQS